MDSLEKYAESEDTHHSVNRMAVQTGFALSIRD